tara:strand:- start:1193 stop:1324 length:132 start_codon:yes stop_codon:yes gene_type:complete
MIITDIRMKLYLFFIFYLKSFFFGGKIKKFIALKVKLLKKNYS